MNNFDGSFLLNFCSEFDGKPPFNPLSLNPVLFYDFTDWTSLYQDVSHTTPVTPAVNQAINAAQDKATLTKYLSQNSTNNAPVTQLDPYGKQCAYFSGVSKAMATVATRSSGTGPRAPSASWPRAIGS